MIYGFMTLISKFHERQHMVHLTSLLWGIQHSSHCDTHRMTSDSQMIASFMSKINKLKINIIYPSGHAMI